MTTSQDVTVGGLLMLEYERVKGEQQARIGFRDNLLYATLASMAAVVTAVLQRDGQAALLLLLPPVSVLLGWTYLVNDEKISAIGRYVREELSPRLADLTREQGRERDQERDQEPGQEPGLGQRGGQGGGQGGQRIAELDAERGQFGGGTQIFGWETSHRNDGRRRSRKRLQLAVDLITFCAAPVAAVVVFWSAGPVRVPLVALSVVELAAVAVLAAQIVLYADLRGR
ncbi:hypothetical protein [Streptomyces sp. HNM0575]|uniref:hypothetical protein n=1 Tax=Streptomyces sp. HNM0575 TaxID=2716338 RepID=UPI003217C802